MCSSSFFENSNQNTKDGYRERSGLHQRLPLAHSVEVLLGRSTLDLLIAAVRQPHIQETHFLTLSSSPKWREWSMYAKMDMFLGAPRFSFACLLAQQPIFDSRSKQKQECTVDGNATHSLLIKMCGDKLGLTQKRRCDGGIEEASPSKTHGPTQTYKLDDTTSEVSSNRTSALSTRNCVRENGTLECIKFQHHDNHSWLLVVGCVVLLLFC